MLLPNIMEEKMKKIRFITLLLLATIIAIASPITASNFFAAERQALSGQEVNFIVQIDSGGVSTRSVWEESTVDQVIAQIQRESGLSLVYGGNYNRQLDEGEMLPLQTWLTVMENEYFDLPYETHENTTSNVWAGHSHVRQEGSPGEHTVTMEVNLLGGTEIGREVVSEEITIAPVDEIIDIGTARLGALADVNAPDFHYVRRVRMEATAYTALYCCTGKHPGDPWFGITASGRRVEHGIVAVDRSIIPLGTRLYVEGYGFAIAADVGGAIRGYKIDLYITNLQDALRFGRRHIYVWILDDI